MTDKKDKEFKDMEPKKDAKGGGHGGGGTQPGIPHNNPPHEQGHVGKGGAQGHVGGGKGGSL